MTEKNQAYIFLYFLFFVKKMWPFDLFNVVLAMVAQKFSFTDVDNELLTTNASIDASIRFSHLIRINTRKVLKQLKEWQRDGKFKENVMELLHNNFQPFQVNTTAGDPITEEQRMKHHLIALGILHLWTVEGKGEGQGDELSSYEQKIKELKDYLSHEIKASGDEKSYEEGIEKLTKIIEKFNKKLWRNSSCETDVSVNVL